MIVGTSTNCSSQLRFAHSTVRIGDVLGRDLGHFDDLLGIKSMSVSKKLEDVWQLFHRLRHRSVENLHHGREADEVDDVLHGVPLDSFLRPGLCENPGPHPRSSVSVELGACPSSVPVGRRTLHQPPPCHSCGGRLRTGPLRRSAAHVATMLLLLMLLLF